MLYCEGTFVLLSTKVSIEPDVPPCTLVKVLQIRLGQMDIGQLPQGRNGHPAPTARRRPESRCVHNATKFEVQYRRPRRIDCRFVDTFIVILALTYCSASPIVTFGEATQVNKSYSLCRRMERRDSLLSHTACGHRMARRKWKETKL